MINHNSIQPKKSLGQNFLKDKNIASKIVNSLNCENNDNVVEIGPGTGALTDLLLKLPIKLTGVEIDKKAIEILNKKYSQKYTNFNLIHSDILKFSLNDIKTDSEKIENQGFKVIGNIPYYLSSEIFFWLFEQKHLIKKSILMVQKEVAKRLSAAPRTKDYGILTVATNLIGSSKILFDVSPTCFFPQPKVTSSIIEINFTNNNIETSEFKSIMKLVRAAFNQRRKTLRNSLTNYINDNIKLNLNDVVAAAEKSGIDYFHKRAEELSSEDFVKFFHFFQTLK